MTPTQLDALIAYIDARVEKSEARDYADGGLIESCRLSDALEVLREAFADTSPEAPQIDDIQ